MLKDCYLIKSWSFIPGCFYRDQPTCSFHLRLASAHGKQRSKSRVSSRWISLRRGRSGYQDLWPHRRISALHILRAASSVQHRTQSLARCCKWLRWLRRWAHLLRALPGDPEGPAPLSLRAGQQVLVALALHLDPSDPSSRRAPVLPEDLGWTSEATERGGCLWWGWSPWLWPWPPSRESRTPFDRIRASHNARESRRCSPWPGSEPPAPAPARRHKHQLRSSALCGIAVFSGADGLPACLRAICLQREEFRLLSCSAATFGDKTVFQMLVRKSKHPQLLRAAISVRLIHLRRDKRQRQNTFWEEKQNKNNLRDVIGQQRGGSTSFCPARCHRREWARDEPLPAPVFGEWGEGWRWWMG